MPRPFHELTLDQFADLLGQFAFTRRIESVHVHHTWRPNHSQFGARAPVESIEGMYENHTRVNGWSDIAQHITIDPRGMIWTGRDWNIAPASAKGFNGNSAAGPFMIEMIGDFDTGRDAFDGAQKASALGVVAHLLQRFSLPVASIRFHNELSTKSCPGRAIGKAEFVAGVEAAMHAASGTVSERAFDDQHTVVRLRTLQIIAGWETRGVSRAEGAGLEQEPREETMTARDVAILTGDLAAGADRAIFGDTANGFTPEEQLILSRHVVNLRLGMFSDCGLFETSLADVQRIFNQLLPEELERRQAEGQALRLVFYAHGGLVSEESGIRPVLRRLAFWRENGLYPIFFCWETGLKETLADLLASLFKGQRNLVTDAIDKALEFAAGAAGRQVWSQMKRAAELASLPGGGARTVAELTRDFWNDHHASMEIHAVGHSAGAIFHAYYLPMLLDQKPKNGVPPLTVRTLHFLAPASTIELFRAKLMPLIGPDKRIAAHTMYTMNKFLEKADKAGPYNKSLLYFVSNAFETGTLPAPVLGLQESIENDSRLIRFYGLSRTQRGVGTILYSKTPDDAPLDSRTRSTTHGDFDNEVDTMNSVARRILGRPDGSIVSFVDETGANETSRALSATPAAAAAPEVIVSSSTRAAGARRALCIGIDAYPGANALNGCVNDAQNWAMVLGSLGFSVKKLLNQQATHRAILDAMRGLITSAKAGDVIAIQFSGHGTRVQDYDGDEADGKDEALVPIDFSGGRFLIDDEIRAIMSMIPSGVNVTCFMDCCHSGTNTRLFGPTPQALPAGFRARHLPVTDELASAHAKFRASMPTAPVAPRSEATMREVNFAACLPTEQALESDGAGHFTTHAIKVIRGGIEGTTHEQFQAALMKAFGPSPRQHPMPDGGEGYEARLLLAPLTAGSAPAGGSQDTILARLDSIEARLARLGV
jgi:hypothetical protein